MAVRGLPRAMSRLGVSRTPGVGGRPGVGGGTGALLREDLAGGLVGLTGGEAWGAIRRAETAADGAGRADFFGFAGLAAGPAAGLVRGLGRFAADCRAPSNWAFVSPVAPGIRRCFASFSSASRESAVSGGVGIEGVSQRSSTGVRRLAQAKRSDVKKRLVSLVVFVHQRPAEDVIREPVSRF